LRRVLEQAPDIRIIAEACDGREAVDKYQEVSPDVVVMDLSMPGIGGLAAIRRIRARDPAARILAFSIHSSKEYMVRMAQCGARGYVTKDRPTTELLEAIKHVFRGGLHFPAGLIPRHPASGCNRKRDQTKKEFVKYHWSIVNSHFFVWINWEDK
jgi:DNA-binding NarL/FixJ family response regulator